MGRFWDERPLREREAREEEGRTGSGKRGKEREERGWARRPMCLLSVLCVRGLSFVEEQQQEERQANRKNRKEGGVSVFFCRVCACCWFVVGLLLFCFCVLVVWQEAMAPLFFFSFLPESGLGLVGFSSLLLGPRGSSDERKRGGRRLRLWVR